MRTLALLPLLLAVAACGSYSKDLAMICNAPEHAGVSAGDDPSQQSVKVSRYIAQHLSSRQGRTFFIRLGSAGTAKGVAAMVRDEAARNGISSCPLADKQEAAANAYRTDLENICNAETAARVETITDPAARMDALARYMDAHLKTPQGLQLFLSFGNGSITHEQWTSRLRTEAHQAGVTPCPLAEH